MSNNLRIVFNPSLLFTMILFLLFTVPSFSQEDIEDKIKDKATERKDRKVDEGIDEGLNVIEEGINSLFKKKDKAEEVEEEDEEAQEEKSVKNNKKKSKQTEEDAEENTEEAEEVKVVKSEPSLKAYSKFDFIPGEKTIFFENFSDAAIGDFPAAWNTNGSGEVMTLNNFPGNWFFMRNGGAFQPDIKGPFPENYTIEYDIIFPNEEEYYLGAIESCISSVEDPNRLQDQIVPGNFGFKFHSGPQIEHSFSNYNSEGYDLSNSQEKPALEFNKKYHVSLWVQKTRVRYYINEHKVFDLPRAIQPNVSYNIFRFSLWGSEANVLINNFRVAVGLPDTRNKLITEGKLVVHGINFDSGKDKIKPESYGILKEISKVLAENPTVKVKIVGHTDSDGDDASNLTLSQKRAEAVKASLKNDFGIDESRMVTDGKGEKEPMTGNDTKEGKANNRRVEFIKL